MLLSPQEFCKLVSLAVYTPADPPVATQLLGGLYCSTTLFFTARVNKPASYIELPRTLNSTAIVGAFYVPRRSLKLMWVPGICYDWMWNIYKCYSRHIHCIVMFIKTAFSYLTGNPELIFPSVRLQDIFFFFMLNTRALWNQCKFILLWNCRFSFFRRTL